MPRRHHPDCPEAGGAKESNEALDFATRNVRRMRVDLKLNDSDRATSRKALLLSRLVLSEDFATPDRSHLVTKLAPPRPDPGAGGPSERKKGEGRRSGPASSNRKERKASRARARARALAQASRGRVTTSFRLGSDAGAEEGEGRRPKRSRRQPHPPLASTRGAAQ